jgi:hypothetical protein
MPGFDFNILHSTLTPEVVTKSTTRECARNCDGAQMSLRPSCAVKTHMAGDKAFLDVYGAG